MRVAVVLTGQPVERALTALAAGLASRSGIECRHKSAEELAADDGAVDVALAGSWQGAIALSGLRARRLAWVVSAMEDRPWPPAAPQRAAAAAALGLPLAYVATSRALADELEQAFPGHGVRLVRLGLDPALAPTAVPPAPALRAPLRVLVHGDAPGPGDGVDDAFAAVRAMRARNAVVTVRPSASADERAAAYRASDVLLDLGRRAGDSTDTVAAFAGGATCVTTSAGGREEALVDGESGLLTSWDDTRGTARLLDLLARDRRLLHRLRRNAWETARAWPSAEQASRLLALALQRIAAEPSPDPDGRAAGLAADIRARLDAATLAVA